MTAFEFVPEPADKAGPPPTPLTEDERLIAACAALGGHSWRLDGTPEETPRLECEDCPVALDLVQECLDWLDGSEQELGGRTVVFGIELPADAEPYSIPVHAWVENVVYPGGPWGDTEYDIEVHIEPREVAP